MHISLSKQKPPSFLGVGDTNSRPLLLFVSNRSRAALLFYRLFHVEHLSHTTNTYLCRSDLHRC